LPFVSCEPNSFRVLQLHVPACTKCSRVCKHTRPQVGSIGPIGTLSVEATIAGSCMYIYGGWCHRGLPDSLLQLQLGLEPSELPDEKAHQPYVFFIFIFSYFYTFFCIFSLLFLLPCNASYSIRIGSTPNTHFLFIVSLLLS
jgi:hypothetical protein